MKINNTYKSAALRSKLTCVILSFCLLIAICLLSACSNSDAKTNNSSLEEAKVVRVVDGDTLHVQLNGREEKVRLIGVDAPESVAPQKERNTPEGKAASDFLKNYLPAGTTVWLQKDTNDLDKYNRLLRYVWVEEPELNSSGKADKSEVQSKMLNAIILENGHAKAKSYPPDTLYDSVFKGI